MKNFARRLSVFAAAAALTACADKPNAPLPPEVSKIAVTPSSASLFSINRTTTLALSASDAGNHSMPLPNITWSSSDASVASVDQAGKVKAVKDGDVIITAQFTPAIKSTATVSVRAAIDLKVFLSAMTNATLDAASDTATVRVIVTDKP